MAGAFADGVEGDFEDDEGFDFDAVAGLREGGGEDLVGEGSNFEVGEAGVGFADGGEGARFFIAHGEGVVAQDAAPFAVAVFHGGDDDIERGEAFFEFDPGQTSATGLVGAGGVFDQEALVSGGADVAEVGVDFLCAGCVEDFRMAKGGRKGEGTQELAAVVEGFWSAQGIPSEWKYLAGIFGWVLHIAYFSLAGRRSGHAA